MLKKIRVDIENLQKAVKIPTGMRLLIRRCCHAVLELEGFAGAAQVDVTLVDNDQIHEINLAQRNIDAPTDVLSFPLFENDGEGTQMLGDIVLSLEKCRAQAEEFGHSFERECAFLTVHSTLHLLGYDHVDSEAEDADMRARQTAIVNGMGLGVKEKE